MYKLVNYRCESCEHDEEDYIDDKEETPLIMEESCPKCGGKMEKFNLKDNPGRWKYLD